MSNSYNIITPYYKLFLKMIVLRRAWWYIAIIPALWRTTNSRLVWAREPV
jgi:hypothetical protein